MIDFTSLQGLTIPQGNVTKITRNGAVLWESGGDEPVVPIYTNQLPRAEAIDSENPYNEVGYKVGYYVGSSAPYESKGATSDWLTGYIRYVGDKPIYVKGVSWTTASHCRLYSFSDKNTRVSPGITGSGGKLTTYFTHDVLGDNYFKLTPMPSAYPENGNTVNYIRFSFATGTPSAVIITIDEEIL